jgi:hypothetical protein
MWIARQFRWVIVLAALAISGITPGSADARAPTSIDDSACGVRSDVKSMGHQTDTADATDGCTYNFTDSDTQLLFLIQPMPEYYKILVDGGLKLGAHIEPITIGGTCKGELLSHEGIPGWKPLYAIEFYCPSAYFVVDTQGSGLDRASLIAFANRVARTKFAQQSLYLSPERRAQRQRVVAAQAVR